MVSLAIAILKTARPRQWLKNLYEEDLFKLTLVGFVALSFLVSSVYFINDVFDVESDRVHPFKRRRPIASGRLSIPLALFLSLLGVVGAFLLSYTLSRTFFWALFSYFILQIIYTLFLKKLVILDILAIATGFVLRECF